MATLLTLAALVLAIARPDGRLVPFAAYDHGRWTTTSSHAGTWQVWRPGDEHPRRATITGETSVESHCSRMRALATDLPAIPTPAHTFPLTLGVATDIEPPPGALHPIAAVARTDARWRAAREVVRGRITQLDAEADVPRSPMYVMAEDDGTSGRPRGCGPATITTGWLLPDAAGRLTLRGARVFHTDCDGKTLVTARPLASLRLDGRVFWVLQRRVYEGERWVISEIQPARVRQLLAVEGGGC